MRRDQMVPSDQGPVLQLNIGIRKWRLVTGGWQLGTLAYKFAHA